MWPNNVVSKNTRPNVHRLFDLRIRLLHPVRILGGPIMQVMAINVAIIVENTFVREQNVFGKMIIFVTCIKKLSTISQCGFIINIQQNKH